MKEIALLALLGYRIPTIQAAPGTQAAIELAKIYASRGNFSMASYVLTSAQIANISHDAAFWYLEAVKQAMCHG